MGLIMQLRLCGRGAGRPIGPLDPLGGHTGALAADVHLASTDPDRLPRGRTGLLLSAAVQLIADAHVADRGSARHARSHRIRVELSQRPRATGLAVPCRTVSLGLSQRRVVRAAVSLCTRAAHREWLFFFVLLGHRLQQRQTDAPFVPGSAQQLLHAKSGGGVRLPVSQAWLPSRPGPAPSSPATPVTHRRGASCGPLH